VVAGRFRNTTGPKSVRVPLCSVRSSPMLDLIRAVQGLRAIAATIRAAREGRWRYVLAVLVVTLLVGRLRVRLERRRA
jgi:hypothetical protein